MLAVCPHAGSNSPLAEAQSSILLTTLPVSLAWTLCCPSAQLSRSARLKGNTVLKAISLLENLRVHR